MDDKRIPLKVALIGTGWVATARYMPAFRLDSRVKILAVMDPNEEKAKVAALKFDIPTSVGRLEDVLRLRPDIVAICTPPWTHAELAIACMDSGCHVIVEKPMAMNVQEGRAMVQAALGNRVRMSVSHNFLFSRSMKKAEHALGSIGKLTQVIGVQLSSPRRRLPTWYSRLPGGLFFDESPHMIYLMQRFLNGSAALELARAKWADPGAAQPVEHVEVKFRSADVMGQLQMFFNAPISEWLLFVMGTEKILILDVFRDIFIALNSDGRHAPLDILRSSASFVRQLTRGFIASGFLYTTRKLLYGHETLVRLFIDSVINGSQPPVTPEQGLRILQTMEQVLQSCGIEERNLA